MHLFELKFFLDICSGVELLHHMAIRDNFCKELKIYLVPSDPNSLWF